MRVAILAALWLGPVLGAVADDPYVDREAVFARAAALALDQLEVDSADLQPFSIHYGLTLLETGYPEGMFVVTLLLRSTREISGAASLDPEGFAGQDPEAVERMFRDADDVFNYRTVVVTFPEGGEPALAEFSSVALNADPDVPAAARP